MTCTICNKKVGLYAWVGMCGPGYNFDVHKISECEHLANDLIQKIHQTYPINSPSLTSINT